MTTKGASKVCSKCGEDKSTTEFSKDNTKTTGLSSQCKPCRAVKKRQSRLDNIDTYKVREENYRKSHREESRLRSEEWRRENPDKHKNLMVKYRLKPENREKAKATSAEWRKNNPERVKELNAAHYKKDYESNKAKHFEKAARRRATRLSATPDWLTKDQIDQMKEYYQMAQDLKITTGKLHHVDHIVPLQGENVCGLHVPSNLQVLTAYDNLVKGNKLEEAT